MTRVERDDRKGWRTAARGADEASVAAARVEKGAFVWETYDGFIVRGGGEQRSKAKKHSSSQV